MTKRRSNIAVKKQALIESLRSIRQDLLSTIENIDHGMAEEVFLGSWCILDLLAHLEGWDYTNIEASKQILSGELPAFYNEFDKDWSSYNSQLVAKYRRSNLSRMIENVRKSHITLLDYLCTLAPEEIFRDQGVRRGSYKVIISRLLNAEMKDEIEHLHQIEEFLRLGK